MNKIEIIKQQKPGLEVVHDIPRFASAGWQSIPEDDRERLKWTGVFFRKQTPGEFMMRVRMPNGISTAEQFRALARISDEFGKGFADITTRQQMQLRSFRIEHVEEIWQRLEAVGLVSLQTGMDNIRNVVGCPVAGLTPNELFDASPVVQQFNSMLLRNPLFTNLPRKFNVTITGCKENCSHAETQDLALTPASKEIAGERVDGFNVAVGGKMGSGGYRMATPLDLFVSREEAAALCAEMVFIFRDHGARELRTKARLAFLIDAWGAEKFRKELERRADRPLPTAGKEERSDKHNDHIGIFRQQQAGLNYVGLAVPVGRLNGAQMSALADLAERYGSGLIRLTISQNVIIPNVADTKIGALTEEPLLKELRYDPSGVMRGLVSCTGMDYCHFALIETKQQALKTTRALEKILGDSKPISMCWSGCPSSCANQAAADIGFIGKNIRVDGQVEEAVDIYLGGSTGPAANPPIKIMEDVPCDDLPALLSGLVKHGAFKAMRQQLRKIPQTQVVAPARAAEPGAAKAPRIDPKEIAEGAAKLMRLGNEEIAVFKHQGEIHAIQNICPHEGGQLCKGWIEDGAAVCPLHGYKFDLKSGACATDGKLSAKIFTLTADGDGFVLESKLS